MPDGSWLSIFVEENGDIEHHSNLPGWLSASLESGILTVTFEWELSNGGVGDVVVEKYRVVKL